jgi:hypothetical protein
VTTATITNTEESIQAAARRACEEAGNCEIEAVNTLIRYAEEDGALYRAMTKDSVRRRAELAIAAIRTALRQTPSGHNDNGGAFGTCSQGERIMSVAETFWDFILYGGKRLGDATIEEIAQSAAFFRSQGKTYLTKALFQEKVVAALKKAHFKGTRAEESGIGITRLEELHKAAEAEVA